MTSMSCWADMQLVKDCIKRFGCPSCGALRSDEIFDLMQESNEQTT